MDEPTEDFPATSPPLPDDYSDVASAQSEEDAAAERQKYQRGGRKKNTAKSRMPPIPEPMIAQDPEHREEIRTEQEETQVNGTKQEERQANGTTCPECAARKQKAPSKQRPPFETGIRSFNLKKAAGSGGRPVGLRTTAPESKKTKKKSAKKKKKKPEPEVKESETEEESTSEEDDVDEGADEKGEESKPVRIKLDLDLMIEIFLKAKIKGEVTITFLE